MGGMLFSAIMLAIGVIEHRGGCFPLGEGFVTALVKISCKKYNTTVMRHIFKVEWWKIHSCMAIDLVEYD